MAIQDGRVLIQDGDNVQPYNYGEPPRPTQQMLDDLTLAGEEHPAAGRLMDEYNARLAQRFEQGLPRDGLDVGLDRRVIRMHERLFGPSDPAIGASLPSPREDLIGSISHEHQDDVALPMTTLERQDANGSHGTTPYHLRTRMDNWLENFFWGRDPGSGGGSL